MDVVKAIAEFFASKEIGAEVPALEIRSQIGAAGLEGRRVNNALSRLVKAGYLDIKGVKRAAKYIRIADKPTVKRAKKAKPAKAAKRVRRAKPEVSEALLSSVLGLIERCNGCTARYLYSAIVVDEKRDVKAAAKALVKVGAIRVEGTRAQTKYVLA